MSEPARQYPSPETGNRPPAPSAPLRDWLSAMRAVPSDAQPAEAPAAPARPSEPTRAPRLVVPTPPRSAEESEDIAEIMAENLMLKAKLRLETERRDELQTMLAQELRDIRAHVEGEMARFEELRAERDLWMARAEALAQPLFQKR